MLHAACCLCLFFWEVAWPVGGPRVVCALASGRVVPVTLMAARATLGVVKVVAGLVLLAEWDHRVGCSSRGLLGVPSYRAGLGVSIR